MKILITGSSGMMGGSLVEELREHEVHGYDRVNRQDILDTEGLAHAMRYVDVVVHLAAIPHPHSEFSGRDYFETNIQGTFNVIEAAVKAGVKRFIYSSSTAYYGLTRGAPLPENEETLDYTQVFEPQDIDPCWLYYGSSKIASEAMLAAYGLSKQIQVVVFRFPPCNSNPSTIASIMHGYKTHITVEDTSKAIKKAVEYEGTLWFERFNLSTEGIDSTKMYKILWA